MKMDWTTDKKGDAVKSNDENEEAVEKTFFQIQKEKILQQIKNRLERDRAFLYCSVTGNEKVGKTGIGLDCRTEEEIEKGMKVLLLDLDDGAEATWDSGWDRTEDIIIFNPLELKRDGTPDWDAIFNNARGFVEFAKEMIEEGNVKAFILDGVDKAYEGSSDVLRDHLVKQQQRTGTIIHASDSVHVSPLDWKIRNRIYNRLLDLVGSLECDRFMVTHMKPLYDNINVPVPIGETPDWHKSTPARFNQMIHINTVTKDGVTNHIATLKASKTNPSLVGKEWTIFTTSGHDSEEEVNAWYGIPELREGTI